MLLSTGMIPRSRFSTAENLRTVAQSADSAGLARVWMGIAWSIQPTTSRRVT